MTADLVHARVQQLNTNENYYATIVTRDVTRSSFGVPTSFNTSLFSLFRRLMYNGRAFSMIAAWFFFPSLDPSLLLHGQDFTIAGGFAFLRRCGASPSIARSRTATSFFEFNQNCNTYYTMIVVRNYGVPRARTENCKYRVNSCENRYRELIPKRAGVATRLGRKQTYFLDGRERLARQRHQAIHLGNSVHQYCTALGRWRYQYHSPCFRLCVCVARWRLVVAIGRVANSKSYHIAKVFAKVFVVCANSRSRSSTFT